MADPGISGVVVAGLFELIDQIPQAIAQQVTDASSSYSAAICEDPPYDKHDDSAHDGPDEARPFRTCLAVALICGWAFHFCPPAG